MGYAPFELGGKVAVVFGGTSGIGRAISHGLAEAGADVIATSRDGERVETVAAELEGRGRQTLRLTSDVMQRDSIRSVLDAAVEAFGKVEELAGVAVFLASDASSFVTREIIAVDGGFLASGVNT